MGPTIRTIWQSEGHHRCVIDFFGDDIIVTVTSTPSVIREWISSVRFAYRSYLHCLVVGVGVYWSPFGCGPDPPAETLQLCVGKRCLIIQLSYCPNLPIILRRFLLESSTTFVGVWNAQDERKLAISDHNLAIGKLVDIRYYLEDNFVWTGSFESIVKEFLGYEGVRADQDISMSDWDRPDLRLDQILQASIDAYVCFKLGVRRCIWKKIQKSLIYDV